jgi:hypothetical protein
MVENICACRNTYGFHEAWILQREEFNLKYVNIIKFPAVLIGDFGIEKRAEFKEKSGKKKLRESVVNICRRSRKRWRRFKRRILSSL